VERGDPPDDQQKSESQDEEAFVYGSVNYSANHLLLHRVLEDERAGNHLVARF